MPDTFKLDHLHPVEVLFMVYFRPLHVHQIVNIEKSDFPQLQFRDFMLTDSNDRTDLLRSSTHAIIHIDKIYLLMHTIQAI